MLNLCDMHAGHVENIRELSDFKRKLDGGEQGMGEIDRLWQAIEKKVSKGMVITFAVLIITVVSGLFGLVYHSNSRVLDEMVAIKVNVGLINDKLK